MSKRHFSLLLMITVVAALAVSLLVPQKTGREPGSQPGLLLPDVGERINDVSGMRVLAEAETAVTLRRADQRWVIEELNGFPADWGRLRQLLADLAQAEVVEQKTDNPRYYDRLGVEDPDQAGAAGVLLTLDFGDEARALVVGKDAGSRDGQYVRLADSARSVLIDRTLNVARTPVDWAEREITDVAAAEVAEVEIIHPDGDWIRATKASVGDTDFSLESLPEGREVTSSWSVNSLAGALSGLQMDAVEPRQEQEPGEAVRFRLLTFAGVEYMVQAWQEGENHWLRLQASIPVVMETESEEGAGTAAPDARQTEVDAFNDRAGAWIFQIPEYKYSTLTKRLESLLKPLESDEANSGG